MRLVKLGLGWLAICALTAAGSYYGAIELDQDLGLQAKLCPSCAAGGGAVTPPGPAPGNPNQGSPGSTGSTGNPTPTGNPNPPVAQPPVQAPSAPVSNPNPPQTTPTYPNPNPSYRNPGNPMTPPPQQRPVYRPPMQAPVQIPPTRQAPAPGIDMSAVTAQYNALLDRANSINNEFAQIERDLKSQGQSLRADIASARSTMISSMQGAAAAIRAKDPSTATRLMQIAEQKINYLEQSR